MGYSTFDGRPAGLECRTEDRCQASPEAEGNLGDPVLARPEGRLRDRALFDFAIDSKLRGCDLVRVRIGDLVTG